MSQAHFRAVVLALRQPAAAPTERELEVAYLTIIDGRTLKEAAEELGVAAGTAKAHLGRFAVKLGMPVRECRRVLPRAYWSSRVDPPGIAGTT